MSDPPPPSQRSYLERGATAYPRSKRQKSLRALAEILAALKPQQVNSIIQFLDDRAIDRICTLIFNVVHRDRSQILGQENIEKLLKCLSGKRSMLTYLTKKNNKIAKKRRYLKQSGGFLATLAGIALPLLAEVIISQVTK